LFIYDKEEEREAYLADLVAQIAADQQQSAELDKEKKDAAQEARIKETAKFLEENLDTMFMFMFIFAVMLVVIILYICMKTLRRQPQVSVRKINITNTT